MQVRGAALWVRVMVLAKVPRAICGARRTCPDIVCGVREISDIECRYKVECGPQMLLIWTGDLGPGIV